MVQNSLRGGNVSFFVIICCFPQSFFFFSPPCFPSSALHMIKLGHILNSPLLFGKQEERQEERRQYARGAGRKQGGQRGHEKVGGGEREEDEGGETAVFWSPAVLCFGP